MRININEETFEIELIEFAVNIYHESTGVLICCNDMLNLKDNSSIIDVTHKVKSHDANPEQFKKGQEALDLARTFTFNYLATVPNDQFPIEKYLQIQAGNNKILKEEEEIAEWNNPEYKTNTDRVKYAAIPANTAGIFSKSKYANYYELSHLVNTPSTKYPQEVILYGEIYKHIHNNITGLSKKNYLGILEEDYKSNGDTIQDIRKFLKDTTKIIEINNSVSFVEDEDTPIRCSMCGKFLDNRSDKTELITGICNDCPNSNTPEPGIYIKLKTNNTYTLKTRIEDENRSDYYNEGLVIRKKHTIIPFGRDINLSVPATRSKEKLSKDDIIIVVDNEQNRLWYLASKIIFRHPNLKRNEQGTRTFPGDDEYKHTYTFCTSVPPHKMLQDNPRAAGIIVLQQLETTNLGSPLDRDSGSLASLITGERVMKCCKCNTTIKKSQPPLRKVLRLCSRCELKPEYLEEIHHKKEGVWLKKIQDTDYVLYPTDNGEEELSTYYKPIQASELGIEHIPKKEYDMCVVGLGSAGTQILQQVCRTTLAESYLFIDDDIVERKNKRNQWYTEAYINRSKAFSSKYIIEAAHSASPGVVACNAKLDPATHFFNTKIKYLVAGLDNLETRLQILEAIEKDPELCEYLIDARYDGDSASLYLIPTNNKDAMKYYREALEEDMKIIPEEVTNTCTRWDIIPIYHITSSFVTRAMLRWEQNLSVPSHYEITADPMPRFMTIKGEPNVGS
jgi:hypothetical protein